MADPSMQPTSDLGKREWASEAGAAWPCCQDALVPCSMWGASALALLWIKCHPAPAPDHQVTALLLVCCPHLDILPLSLICPHLISCPSA
jgi:hypothetical protein